MVLAHTMQKVKARGHSAQKLRVETDGQTDGRTEAIVLPPVLTRLVSK